MNIRDLKYVVVTAQEKNFNKAALKAFVSQPTLSMQIKKLEDELQIKIFERSHKNFLITKTGKEIVKKAQKILQEVEEMRIIAKNSKDIFASEVRIGAFPTLAPYFFPKVVKKIHKKFPRLKLFLVEEKTEILIEKLKSGEIDAALLATPILEDDFAMKKIFHEEFFLAVAKKHKFAKYKKISKKDLKNQKLMLLEDGHCLRRQALEICSMFGAYEAQEFRASSLETLRQMVAINAGITLIPEIALQKNDDISYIKIENAPVREIAFFQRKTALNAKILDELSAVMKGFAV